MDGDVLGNALFDDISNGILGFYESLVRVLLRALGRRSDKEINAIDNGWKAYQSQKDLSNLHAAGLSQHKP